MIIKSFFSLLKDESGATAIEYGLIAALVSVAAILTLRALGGSLIGIFGTVAAELGNASATTTP
jgi:pilus assembly protein Flp/PilA